MLALRALVTSRQFSVVHFSGGVSSHGLGSGDGGEVTVFLASGATFRSLGNSATLRAGQDTPMTSIL